MQKPTRTLTIFLAATFLWTWACYAPIALGHHSPYQMPWMPFLIAGGMGPSLVGVALVLFSYTKEAKKDFWRRFITCRLIAPGWWLVIFLFIPLLNGTSVLVDLALSGSAPGMEQLRSLLANPIMIPLTAFISFMSGPWSEEFGWRGLALDPLIERFGVIRGSVVLGLVWGVWHLPLYFMAETWHGEMGFRLAGFWCFVAYNVGLALVMTWVYLNNRRSILTGLLIHFTANFSMQLIAPSSDTVELVRAALFLMVGLVGCLRLRDMAAEKEALLLDEVERHTI